jgi:hypothetical protein
VIGPHSLDQRALDLGVAPASDSGLGVLGDVRRSGDEGRGVEGEAAGEGLSGISLPSESRGEWQLPQAMMVLTR